MTKPADVSARAWEFACRYQPDGLFADESVLLASRRTLARAFDKAAADLRESYANAFIYIGHAACHGEKCRLPHCWCCCGEDDCEDINEVEKGLRATLRAYTPGETNDQ